MLRCIALLNISAFLLWLAASLTQVAPKAVPPPTPLLRQSNSTSGNYWEITRDGRYVMRYETPEGIIHYETGYLRRTPEGIPYQVKEGYYIYPTPDGRTVRVAYFADHLGFRVISYNISRNFVEEFIKQVPQAQSSDAE